MRQVLHLFAIYFTILENFQAMTYVRKEFKKKKQIKLKKTTNCHRKTNTKNIEHNALYTPNK